MNKGERYIVNEQGIEEVFLVVTRNQFICDRSIARICRYGEYSSGKLGEPKPAAKRQQSNGSNYRRKYSRCGR